MSEQPRDGAGRFAANRLTLQPGQTLTGLSMADEVRLAAGKAIVVDEEGRAQDITPEAAEAGNVPPPNGGDFGGGVMGPPAPLPEKRWTEQLDDAVRDARERRELR